MKIRNRITEMLGIDYPIVQAPMGWIARSQLASAVSNAGGLGIIETSSGELDAIREEIRKMRQLTDKPFGVNIAQAFVRDASIVDFVIGEGIKFVTTSAGDPTKYCGPLKAAGLTVFHVVPTLKAAMKAIEAGVDGLIVEGGEGGGFKNPQPVMSMVLLPLVRENVKVPIIAAGGVCDGATMAACFALGAEGVQMGTRMVASTESPVHPNWKQAIIDAAETDTVFLNQFSKPALRALRTAKTSAYEHESGPQIMAEFGHAKDLYFGGDMEASIALSGQVCGRINSVEPVTKIIGDTVREFHATMAEMAQRYVPLEARV
jgi:enoyl-[acyl-carrier protein] reductase II